MILDLSSQSALKNYLEQKLKQTLGAKLSASELDLCLQATQIIEAKPGKQFWRYSESITGIYIVSEGKARLLDRQNNFLASL